MVLDENTGGAISLEEAKGYVAEFKKKYPKEVISFFVGATHIKSILDQQDCIGIRIYNGYHAGEDRMNQVMVGVDINGGDLDAGVIIDDMAICPPNCPSKSNLI